MPNNFSRRRPNVNIQHLKNMTAGKNKAQDIENTQTTEITNTELSPEEQAEILELETVVKNLEHSFNQVTSIEDPVKQEYKILQEAKKLDIPPETYRRMFESYCLESGKIPKEEKYSWLNPLKFLDQRLGDFVKWCENVSLYSLATVIGQFTLLAAMGAYFIEAPQREQRDRLKVYHTLELADFVKQKSQLKK